MIKIALTHCVGCIFLVVLGCNDLDIKGLDPNYETDAGDVTDEEIPDEALDAGTGDEPPRPDLDDAGVTATRPDGGLPSEPLLGNAASDSFYQGSWRAPIKRSDTGIAGWQSCNLETGWDANDIEKMKAHFEATNQNLFIQHIQWPLASANECDWRSFLALGEAAETDAGVGNVPLTLLAGYGSKNTWENYQAGAINLRTHAQGISSIEGWMVDDFHTSLHNVTSEVRGDYFSKEQVGDLWSASHETLTDMADDLPEMKFIPYIAEKAIADHIMPSLILGVRGAWGAEEGWEDATQADHELYEAVPADANGGGAIAADRIEATAKFNPGPAMVDENFTLKFLYYDRLTLAAASNPDKDVVLIISLNGTDVFQKSLLDEQAGGYADYIQSVEVDLSGVLSAAENMLQFRIEAVGNPVNYKTHKLAYLWHMRIQRTHGPFIFIDPDTMTFVTERDENRTESTVTDHLIATSNDAWRIDDHIDGLFFKGAGRSEQFNGMVHGQILRSLCRHLNAADKLCMEVYWGNEQWVEDLSFDMIAAVIRFEQAQRHTDGVVVWRLENSLGYPEEGVFTERPVMPLDAPFDEQTYDVMAVHPGNTSAMPGWYQHWTVTAPVAGTYKLFWWDNGGTTPLSAENLPERMNKEIWVEGSYEWPDAVITQNITDAGVETEESDVKEFEALEGESISVGMAVYNSFGDADYAAQFRLVDPDGNVLDLSTGEFTSGTSDWGTQAMYDCTVAYYTSHEYRDDCFVEAP